MVDLVAHQREAEAEGRRAVVGALIFDARGRLFVHRRGPDRRFLPGCWDIVGGHVEAGETLLGALAREIREETGWTMRGDPRLVQVEDWESEGPSSPDRRREFDFVVDVEGDLRRPRLERPKHVEFRFITPAEIGLLDENRGADGGFIRRVAELAFSQRDDRGSEP
ncbi:MAG: hypothetical protein AUH85_01065 [Chloroflexi bacterium 13_1_40CM_4_68_4]|nr:MAG: hypothetical protein AUH85_01065 [Chloroflexi bacterium 13_1_40CM_4_68_4]